MSHIVSASPLSSPRDPQGEGALDPGFAARLRDSTKSIHREAERAGFVADLIRGRATPHGYALFLRNLVPVYAMLETGIESLRHVALVACFSNPGLRRLPRLVQDLEAIAGADWATTCPLLPEAEAYARAVETAAAGDGTRLVSHAYARYLGDLSGGQILQPLLMRTLRLDPTMLAFYNFPAFHDLGVPKAAIRDALDSVASKGPRADAIIDEALAAFRHNMALSCAITRAVEVTAD